MVDRRVISKEPLHGSVVHEGHGSQPLMQVDNRVTQVDFSDAGHSSCKNLLRTTKVSKLETPPGTFSPAKVSRAVVGVILPFQPLLW